MFLLDTKYEIFKFHWITDTFLVEILPVYTILLLHHRAFGPRIKQKKERQIAFDWSEDNVLCKDGQFHDEEQNFHP